MLFLPFLRELLFALFGNVPHPNLAKVALRLARINPTEASVERSFSAQGVLHSDLRNSLSDRSGHALLFVQMNTRLVRKETVPELWLERD